MNSLKLKSWVRGTVLQKATKIALIVASGAWLFLIGQHAYATFVPRDLSIIQDVILDNVVIGDVLIPELTLGLDSVNPSLNQLPGANVSFVATFATTFDPTLCNGQDEIALMRGSSFVEDLNGQFLGGTFYSILGSPKQFKFNNYTLPEELGVYEYSVACVVESVGSLELGGQGNPLGYNANFGVRDNLVSAPLRMNVSLCGDGVMLRNLNMRPAACPNNGEITELNGYGNAGVCSGNSQRVCYGDADCSTFGTCTPNEDCDNGGKCSDGTACTAHAQCEGKGNGSCVPQNGDGCSNTCQEEAGFDCSNTVHQMLVGSNEVDWCEPVLLTDSCVTSCGDDIRAGAEECELGDFGGQSCSTLSPGTTGSLSCDRCYIEGSGCYDDPCSPEACNAHGTCTDNAGSALCACSGNWKGAACDQCKQGFSGPFCAPDPVCGDNIKNRAEELCDGTYLDGKTCEDVVGIGSTGTLGCAACQFDTQSCTAAGCPAALAVITYDTVDGAFNLSLSGSSTPAERALYDYDCDGDVDYDDVDAIFNVSLNVT